MRTFDEYINEAKQSYIFGGTDDRSTNATVYYYFPKDKDELISTMSKLIRERGIECDLNDIDTSNVTNFDQLVGYQYDAIKIFNCEKFNCDISDWDTSNVTSMIGSFWWAESFNKDISQWDVSNVTNMYGMFCGAKSFNQDISGWDVRNVKRSDIIFDSCPIKKEYRPKFNKKWTR